MTKVEKEVSVLMLATSFIKMYLDDVVKDSKDFIKYEKPFKLLKALQKICMLYASKADEIIEKSMPILEDIEEDGKKIKPRKKFEKKIRFTDGNIEVNGLVFGTALLIEHKNMRNKVFRANYKLAEEIYGNFNERDSKALGNSRDLSRKYVTKLMETK